jgi:hypothetical protein
MNIRDLPICAASRSVGVGDVYVRTGEGEAVVVGDDFGVEGLDGRISSSS